MNGNRVFLFLRARFGVSAVTENESGRSASSAFVTFRATTAAPAWLFADHLRVSVRLKRPHEVAAIVLVVEGGSRRILFSRAADGEFTADLPIRSVSNHLRLDLAFKLDAPDLRILDKAQIAEERIGGEPFGRVTIMRPLDAHRRMVRFLQRNARRLHYAIRYRTTRELRLLWARRPVEGRDFSRWVAQRETFVPAPKQTGPSVSFLIMPGDSIEPATSKTLASLALLGSTRWQAVVSEGVATTKNASSPRVTLRRTTIGNRARIVEELLAAADGEFIAILDAGDIVSPDALFAFWRCIDDTPDIDIAYSDEDQLTSSGARTDPLLKPGWSPEYLESFNYFGRLAFVRRSLAMSVDAFDPRTGNAVEWDLNLRASSKAGTIRRIPKILCHCAPRADSDQLSRDASATDDARFVVSGYWARQMIDATVAPRDDGTVRSTLVLREPPLVSIVLLEGDDPDALRGALLRLDRMTSYRNREIVIVGRSSSNCGGLRFYRDDGPALPVRWVTYGEPASGAAARNAGAREAIGTLLLFLDIGLEGVNADWLDELVGCVLRPGVGTAGPQLVSHDGTILHAGGIVGMGDCVGSIFQYASPADWGPFGTASVPRNYVVATSRCRIIRRDVFVQVGGFDEAYLTAAGSDLALSWAVWRAGYRAVCTPFATFAIPDVEAEDTEDVTPDVSLLARALNEFGLRDDPYFHPALSSSAAIPSLRLGSDRNSAGTIEVFRSQFAARGSTSVCLFDGAAIGFALTEDCADAAFWLPQSPRSIDTPWAAARFILDRLRGSGDLRRRFPLALSGGADGTFAQWLSAGEGQRQFDLSPDAAEMIRQCFALNIAGPVRRAFQIDDEAFAAIPLGTTPAGSGALLRWLMETGRFEYKLRVEAIWWFALECTEQPALELTLTYLFKPEWQKWFPDGLTVFSRRRLSRWLRAAYGAVGEWLDPDRWPVPLSMAEQIRLAYLARPVWQRAHPDAFTSTAKADALVSWLMSEDANLPQDVWDQIIEAGESDVVAELALTGVNVLGHFCYPSGLRTSTESVATALRQAGCAVSSRDVWVDPLVHDSDRMSYSGLEIYDKTIVHVQPEPYFDEARARGGLFDHKRSYRIGYWYWELEQIPDNWLEQSDKIDELWAATKFVGDALRKRFDKPVYNFLPGLELPAFDLCPKSHFGLDETAFTFLFVFNLMSVMERKNPLGLLRAFREAFGDDPTVSLVLKTSFGDQHPGPLASLHEAAGSNVRIIDAIYSQDETLSLIASCDCYISLHRSEGLGLTMAEAMLLGKPVIATGYSGNIDFMDNENSMLVDFTPVGLKQFHGPYMSGAHWAEPSTAHAVQCMRQVFENRAWGQALGARAKADLSTRLSYAEVGKPMAARLREIDAARAALHPHLA